MSGVAALVIGAGPAGLMAAEALADAGLSVVVVDAKPSLARKFLMAGKSGLNLTRDEDFDTFLSRYDRKWLAPMITAFGPKEVQRWAEGLGQALFVGSTGRVFPKAMKASPLLRAWLKRLAAKGVTTRTRWRFLGWDGARAVFDTPEDTQMILPKVTVLAFGGSSWARLGSDGAWAEYAGFEGLVTPFQPSNTGLLISWSEHMGPHFGKPLKSVRWRVAIGEQGQWKDIVTSRGEAILSRHGLEGGGIYPLIPALRELQDRGELLLDLAPDQTEASLASRLPKAPKGLSRVLRNTLRWPPEKIALFHELTKGSVVPLAGPDLAKMLKSLRIRHNGPRPLDEAISTAGGLHYDALTTGLEMKSRPGVFVAGEMLDWDAPTGGYLLTACLATGLWAGQNAAKFAQGET